MFFRKAKQVVDNDNLPQMDHVPTLIGRDTKIEGAIDAAGEVQVDGLFRGRLQAKSCVVGSHGTVEGEIFADEVIVRGRVTGPIRGYHVHLQDGAVVDGDIINQSIAVDSGARLNGSVWRDEDPLGTAHNVYSAAAPPEPGPSISSPLWGNQDDDNYRPLKAIRPLR